MAIKRTCVFIDNSNVFHNLKDLKKIDSQWKTFYNPLELSKKLAGARELVGVFFYCTPPPQYLLQDSTGLGRYRHAVSMAYYSAVEKLPLITLKWGNLKGAMGSLVEKNLDTQLSTDMTKGAALNEFDVAILVSGDGDYKSAADIVKNTFQKRIEMLFFRGSLSMSLKKICDLTRRARPSYFVELPFKKPIDLLPNRLPGL